MKELHLTDHGWIPVDTPAPPACQDSTTGRPQATIRPDMDTDSHEARGGALRRRQPPKGAGVV